MMQVKQFFIDGLGHQSYFVTDGTSGAAVIDPRRDVEIYLEAAQQAGVKITHVLDTHIHNDYVTGARELANRTGATIVASADAHLGYEYQGVHDGERFQVGDFSFQAVATPGHTPEHVSYVLYEPGSEAPYAVFTGGSMLIASAGRTDLVSPDMTVTLTRKQYHSLLRLLEMLPNNVIVYPTHGAGSFCAATAVSSTRSTTIGQEKLASPAVQAHDEEEFVRQQIAGYGEYPRYYAYMTGINKPGPRILGAIPEAPALTPEVVHEHMQAGVPLVDGRPRDDFAHEHVPGSLNIELDSNFGTYTGWVLPFNSPLMILVEDENGRREAVVQLIRIGYEQVQGYLEGGVASWKAAEFPVESFERIDLSTLHQRWESHQPLTILDVRREEEWKEGHIPGAQHIHVADLPQHLNELPQDRPIATVCLTGHRAELAASMIAATGRQVSAVQGGVLGWIDQGWPSTREETPQPAVAVDQSTHAHP